MGTIHTETGSSPAALNGNLDKLGAREEWKFPISFAAALTFKSSFQILHISVTPGDGLEWDLPPCPISHPPGPFPVYPPLPGLLSVQRDGSRSGSPDNGSS